MINEYDKRLKVSLFSTNAHVFDVGYPAWGKMPTMALGQKAHGHLAPMYAKSSATCISCEDYALSPANHPLYCYYK